MYPMFYMRTDDDYGTIVTSVNPCPYKTCIYKRCWEHTRREAAKRRSGGAHVATGLFADKPRVTIIPNGGATDRTSAVFFIFFQHVRASLQDLVPFVVDARP